MNDLIKQWDKNFIRLVKEDKKAKENGLLIGRYIREGIADGHAFYKIIKEEVKTVVIKHITGLGDDYIINYWGKQTKIDKDYAKTNLEFRDKIDEYFGDKGEITNV